MKDFYNKIWFNACFPALDIALEKLTSHFFKSLNIEENMFKLDFKSMLKCWGCMVAQ